MNNHATTDITGTFSGLVTSPHQEVTWTADAPVGGVLVEHQFVAPRPDRLVHVDVTVTNTTGATLSDIYYWRGADPDNNQSLSGVFDTTQTIESQFFGTGLASVSATQGDGSRIELRAADSRAVVAYQDGTFITAPASIAGIHAGTDPDYTSTSGSSATGNSPIDIAFSVGSLLPGTAATFRVSYYFAEGADADLSATVADPSPVTPGTDAVVTIGVTNAGPDEATDTEIVYTPPPGLAVDTATLPAGCGGTSSGPITCSAGEVDIGASATFDIRLPIGPADTPGTTYSGGAAVATTTASDPDGAGASQADLLIGTRSADLTLAASGPGDLVPGGGEDVVLTADNLGPSDAPSTELTYTPQSGIDVVVGSLPAGCSGGAPGPITCGLGTVAAGGSVETRIPVRLASDAIPGSTYTGAAAAAASADSTDPDGATATPPNITALGREADLIVVAADPGPVTPGTAMTVTIAVTNDGPSDAPSASLDYVPPVDVTIDSSALPAGCAGTPTAITCTLGTVAAGGSVAVAVPAGIAPSAPEGALSGADVDATSSAPDPDTMNNTDQPGDITAGPAVADIEVLATPDGAVVPGETVSVDVDVGNLGPSDTGDPTALTVQPPGGAVFASVPGGCTGGATTGDPITCSIPALTASATTAITVDLAVESAAAGSSTLTGGQAAASNPDDASSGNDVAVIDLTTAARESDLSVAAADPGPVVPGDAASVTVTVTNAGPSDADNVSIVYTPPDTSAVEVGALPAGCVADTPSTGSVTCDRGVVVAGGASVVDLPVRVAASAAVSAVLTAGDTVLATSDSLDADGATAIAEITTGPAEADLALSVAAEPVLDPGEGGRLDLDVTKPRSIGRRSVRPHVRAEHRCDVRQLRDEPLWVHRIRRGGDLRRRRCDSTHRDNHDSRAGQARGVHHVDIRGGWCRRRRGPVRRRPHPRERLGRCRPSTRPHLRLRR